MVKKATALALCLLTLSSCANPKRLTRLLAPKVDVKLSDSIMSHNLQAAMEAVEDGANINEAGAGFPTEISFDDNNTISLCTVQNTSTDIALYLLSQGANPNYSAGKATLLMSEVSIKNLDVCRELIERGADVNAAYGSQNVLTYLLTEGFTDISEEEKENTKDIADLLYDNGFKDNENTLYNFLTVKAAKSTFFAEDIDELAYVVKKAYTADKENSKVPDLIYHLSQGNNREAQKLIAGGKEDWKDMQDFAAIFACSFCDKTTIQLLLDTGMNFSKVILGGNPEDTTLADLAAAYNSWEAVSFLKEKGIDYTSEKSAIKMSLINTKHRDVFKKLFDSNSGMKLYELDRTHDVIDCAFKNNRADFLKTYKSQLKTVSVSVYKTAFINYANTVSSYIINFFAENGYKDIFSEILGDLICSPEQLRLFCGKAEDVNRISENGTAALHGAVINGTAESVAYLINKGADVNQRDEEGNTPLHYAAENGNSGMIEVLIKNKADINAVNDLGETPLIKAAEAHCYHTVRLLIENGADRTIKNGEGLTAGEITDGCLICSDNDKMKMYISSP